MIDKLKKHIINRLGENIDHIDLVLSKFKPITFKRNEQVLKEGEICNYVYYIDEGALQVYVFDSDMNESTRDIVIEDYWCSELMSFGKAIPSTENIRAVEHTKLLAIDRVGFQEMLKTVPQFDMVYKQLLEASYANTVYRFNTFISLSAIERIQWLIKHRPGIMNRFSSKLIASYLGINKDVFSRLKSKL